MFASDADETGTTKTAPKSHPLVPGIEPTTRVEAVGRVLRVEQAHGRKGRDGFAILARHTLLRVNNRDEPDAQSR